MGTYEVSNCIVVLVSCIEGRQDTALGNDTNIAGVGLAHAQVFHMMARRRFSTLEREACFPHVRVWWLLTSLGWRERSTTCFHRSGAPPPQEHYHLRVRQRELATCP